MKSIYENIKIKINHCEAYFFCMTYEEREMARDEVLWHFDITGRYSRGTEVHLISALIYQCFNFK